MTANYQAHRRFSRKGLTAALLRVCLRYDPETGAFIRLSAPKRAAGRALNAPATPSLNDNGYAFISLGRHWRFRAHQLAWLYMTGEWPEADIDHINGDRADNRWANLRAATRRQNLQNTGIRKSNTSGLKGVSYDASRGKWKAQMRLPGVARFIGRFDTKEEASAAYNAFAEAHFGEFVRVA